MLNDVNFFHRDFIDLSSHVIPMIYGANMIFNNCPVGVEDREIFCWSITVYTFELSNMKNDETSLAFIHESFVVRLNLHSSMIRLKGVHVDNDNRK